MAEKNKVDFLGSLPLDINIRKFADSGRPTVVADPDGRAAQIYKEIARKTAARLALKAKDFSTRVSQYCRAKYLKKSDIRHKAARVKMQSHSPCA